MLTEAQLQQFHQSGHVTVPDLLQPHEVQAACDDIEQWTQEFLSTLDESQRDWFVEPAAGTAPLLRKLDNPVFHRPLFRSLAADPRLTSIVEQLIGPGVQVFFSQIFCKPPEVGGPKPIHQDNFYFGPDDPDATLTVWIALDTATVQNGCLYYGEGSNRGPVLPHQAPAGQPFNLQVDSADLQDVSLVPAEVTAGGISIHHGNTLHQSAANRSQNPRRAAAMHYLRNSARLINPALTYDPDLVLQVTK